MNLATSISMYAGGPGSGCNPEVGQCGRKPKGGTTAESTRVYMTRDDIEQKRGWGGETWWEHKWKAGIVVHGNPVTKEDLPPVLYHVTTNLLGVLESGYLRADSTDTAGGLGSSNQNPAVSFTTSRHDALNIQTALLRAGELMRTVDPHLLRRFAREDEQRYGTAPGVLSKAAEEVLGTFRVRQAARSRSRKSANLLDAYHEYLWKRETLAKVENPVLIGPPESFAKIYPRNVGILAVPSRGVPDMALIREKAMGKHDPLHEVQVHGNVPVRGSWIVRRGPFRPTLAARAL